MPTTIALLEREEELATIERVLDSAAGEGGLLIVEGAAGAGKTSLLDAAAQMAGEREMAVLRARGGEFERDFPYGVVRQLFEPLLCEEGRSQELLDGRAALAAPVFDPQVAPAEGGDPLGMQHGLYWLAADLAVDASLALLIDDAQWADLASLRALAYIGRRLDGISIAVVLTVRSGEPGEHLRLIDELRREPGARAIAPSALSTRAAAALVAEEVDGRPTEGFAEACRAATAGNPFLLVELLRALDPADLDPSDESVERLTKLAASGVSGSILARLDRLGDHSTDVARAVAVLEPNAELRLVATLADLPTETVTDACERLVAAHLLSDALPLAFVHPLVRGAVLSALPAIAVAAAHARAARILDADGAAVDAVAAHLLLAEPAGDRWAVARLRAAADAAMGRGAPDAAVRYLRRALREPPPTDDRLEVSHELGLALLRSDDPEGVEVLRGVRNSLVDPVTRAAVAAELSLSLTTRGRASEGLSLLEDALAEIPDQRGSLGLLLRGNLLVQMLFGIERRPEGVIPKPDEVLDAGTLEGRVLMHGMAVLYAFGLGPMEGARELSERSIADPAAVEADTLAGRPPWAALVTLTLADRRDSTEDLFELTIDAARRRGALPAVAAGYGIRASCRLADGALREAQADADIALELAQRLDLAVPLSQWLSAALKVLVARGEYAAAEGLLAEVWGRRGPVPGFPGALFLCARGELRLATGRAAEARHDFLAMSERVEWLPLSNPEILGWRAGLASCEAALDNGEEAGRLAAEGVELARRAAGRRGIGVALRTHGAIVGGDEGIEILREAVGVLGGTEARLQHAHALVDLGATLRRANRRKEAREPLREGLDLAHRCGAVALEERARTELAATGARPRKAVLSGVDSLTPSELRVARMAAEGMTNREIAQSLFVTAKTVETHLRHVYQKLDVSRRTELAGALG